MALMPYLPYHYKAFFRTPRDSPLPGRTITMTINTGCDKLDLVKKIAVKFANAHRLIFEGFIEVSP